MYVTKKEKDVDRTICPHHVVVTMKIGNELLAKYGISNKAQICFSAPSEAEAVKILKEKLERLNG